MERQPRRVDAEFDELAGPDIPLDDLGWNVGVFGILGVHGDPVHQLVVVDVLLGIELLLKSHHWLGTNDT